MKLYDGMGLLDELLRWLGVPSSTFAIVYLRAWYQGKKRQRARFIEGALFAIASLGVFPAAVSFYTDYLQCPHDSALNYALMTCNALGWIGVDTLSEWLRQWGDRRFGK